MVLVIDDIIYRYYHYFMFKDILEELLEKNVYLIKANSECSIDMQFCKSTTYTIICPKCLKIKLILDQYEHSPFQRNRNLLCFECETDTIQDLSDVIYL